MALENVYYACHLFFSISSEWSQWLLCIALEQLKDERFPGTFYWESTEKMACFLRGACTLWWRVRVICWGFENNNVNKGTKQVGFNEMFLSVESILPCSLPRLLSLGRQRRPGKNNSYFTATKLFTTMSAETNMYMLEVTNTNLQQRIVTTVSLPLPKTSPS